MVKNHFFSSNIFHYKKRDFLYLTRSNFNIFRLCKLIWIQKFNSVPIITNLLFNYTSDPKFWTLWKIYLKTMSYSISNGIHFGFCKIFSEKFNKQETSALFIKCTYLGLKKKQMKVDIMQLKAKALRHFLVEMKNFQSCLYLEF